MRITSAAFQKKYGKRKAAKRRRSADEVNREMTAAFLRQCDEAGLNRPLCEFKFHPVRQWRIDFFFVIENVAVEIEGLGGRHQRTKGFLQDMEKYNEMTAYRIRLLRFTTRDVHTGKAVAMLRRVFGT